MSAIKDALDAIREAIKLVDEVKQVSGAVSALTKEVRDIDRRLSRLEGSVNAALLLSGVRNSTRQVPPLLPGDNEDDH
jgi:hypothetical protein